MKFDKYILITGGAGFIGSHLLRKFVINYKNYFIVNVDNLTYASNYNSIEDLESSLNYKFIKGDISDRIFIQNIFSNYKIDYVIHLAAESHVDNSIENPLVFVKTNILGTINLLDQARLNWPKDSSKHLFYAISTDEVFGSLGKTGNFHEGSPYQPKSPYSASKASADHFIRAYGNTYNLPYIISNCSNNYGPNQHLEKLIPLTINNIVNNKHVPIYGDGKAVRDWIFVMDHVDAIDTIFHHGNVGENYNVGSNKEIKNIDLVKLICSILDKRLKLNNSELLIKYVQDRPGHDLRYAIDASKIMNELNWKPRTKFNKGLEITIDWYIKKLVTKI
ncbi:MAG: dTDP-glucose 4,6-dehydratase [Flavobacteriales bacterium]|nr:dTDP-glucose 4,6-dehydratase [Flavobacteriales bacterium]|tara:strand:- start:12176 stop:13177 length:1002 start_codon:yes stop_codon:yes gene_type:complete